MGSFSNAAMLVACFAALTLQADAALDVAKMKRPLTSYFTWLKDSRKSIKGKNIAEVGKKAGEMWKSLSADKKKVYEERAVKAKAEYVAYIAKVKGTDAFKAYQEKLAAARKKKLKRSVKIAMGKVKMDASLKRPLSGYMLWFKDTRKSIKGKNIAEVGKAGEMWKSLPADKKKTYADRALEAKKKYSAYVATGKGAAALKAYKDGIAKAKAPLIAKDENLNAKKAAKKAKAKAKAAAKKEKVKALKAKAKAKAVAKKAAKAAKTEKAKAAKVAKIKKATAAKAAAKAKKIAKAKANKAAKAKKVEAKKAAKAKKAAAAKAKKAAKAAKKATKKAKPAKKAKKAKVLKKAKKPVKKPVKKAKKLVEFVPSLSMPVVAFFGLISCGAITLALLQIRQSVSNPSEEPLLD